MNKSGTFALLQRLLGNFSSRNSAPVLYLVTSFDLIGRHVRMYNTGAAHVKPIKAREQRERIDTLGETFCRAPRQVLRCPALK